MSHLDSLQSFFTGPSVYVTPRLLRCLLTVSLTIRCYLKTCNSRPQFLLQVAFELCSISPCGPPPTHAPSNHWFFHGSQPSSSWFYIISCISSSSHSPSQEPHPPLPQSYGISQKFCPDGSSWVGSSIDIAPKEVQVCFLLHLKHFYKLSIAVPLNVTETKSPENVPLAL